MGGLTSTLGQIVNLSSATRGVANAVSGFVDNVTGKDNSAEKAAYLQAQQDALVVQQLQERQRLEMAEKNETARLEKEKMTADTQTAEQTRLTALKRAMAKQRASFGASGVSGTGGSSDAVLLGLYEESDAERIAREKSNAIKQKALESDLTAQHRKNLLELQQLQEKQRLARLV